MMFVGWATPEGSTSKISGLRVLAMVMTEKEKSRFKEQQIQPSDNSTIFMSAMA